MDSLFLKRLNGVYAKQKNTDIYTNRILIKVRDRRHTLMRSDSPTAEVVTEEIARYELYDFTVNYHLCEGCR